MNLKYVMLLLLLVSMAMFLPADHTPGSLHQPETPETGSKIDSRISMLAELSKMGADPHAPIRLHESAMDMIKDGAIDVVIETVKGAAATRGNQVGDPSALYSGLVREIQKAGGILRPGIGNLMYAKLPLEHLETIARSEAVKRIRLPNKAVPHNSEGALKMRAGELQKLPPFRSNKQVKVCVLDVGFIGYKDRLGRDLPAQVTTRSFTENEDLEGDYLHGTACAEIIYDMYPEVDLYLANFDTIADFEAAVDWIIENEIDVVTFSIGWYLSGPLNGINLQCDLIKKATEKGVVWVTSAGNSANEHWAGTFNDPDGNGWHNFGDGTEMFKFKTLDAFLAFNPLVQVILQWDDWGEYNSAEHTYSGSNQDYDMYFYYKSYGDDVWRRVPKNPNLRQDGTTPPTESTLPWKALDIYDWGVKIKRVNATKNVKFDMYFLGLVDVPNPVPEGSMTCPSNAEHVVTVGAVDWRDSTYHDYSSRGPTSDGRIKPDFASYAGVSTYSYGPMGFYGTSASSPHAAGAIALMKSRTGLTGEQVVELLKSRVTDKGEPGKDIMFGYGVMNLLPRN